MSEFKLWVTQTYLPTGQIFFSRMFYLDWRLWKIKLRFSSFFRSRAFEFWDKIATIFFESICFIWLNDTLVINCPKTLGIISIQLCLKLFSRSFSWIFHSFVLKPTFSLKYQESIAWSWDKFLSLLNLEIKSSETWKRFVNKAEQQARYRLLTNCRAERLTLSTNYHTNGLLIIFFIFRTHEYRLKKFKWVVSWS